MLTRVIIHIRQQQQKFSAVLKEIKSELDNYTLRFEFRIYGGNLKSLERASEILNPKQILQQSRVGVNIVIEKCVHTINIMLDQ